MPRSTRRIRRSSGGRWSSWSGPGGRPEELAKEFEPSAQTIRNWVEQADRDEGRRAGRPDDGGARGAPPPAPREPAAPRWSGRS